MTRSVAAIATALIAMQVVTAQAQAPDTLRPYMAKGAWAYYNDRRITTQAARFDLPAPVTVESVTIAFGGRAGRATVHLYGAEAGAPAPLLEHDLVEPVVVTKSHGGMERITVTFHRAVLCESTQFFIAVDHLSSGVTLLSDTRQRTPACMNAADDAYYAQALGMDDGTWQWGRCAYAIDAVVHYPERVSPEYFADATADAMLPDSASRNMNIALADIDGNGTIDLAIDGRLYRNDGNAHFADVTAAAGLAGNPAANIVLDVDNDLRPDILFLPAASDSASATLYLNNGDGTFTPHAIALPRIAYPSTYTIGDINGDGYLDLFIGVPARNRARSEGSRLLLNNGALGFADSTHMLLGEARGPLYCDAAQFVDYNGDGLPDLHLVAADGARDELWEGRRDGSLANVTARVFTGGSFQSAGHSVATAWADYDNDGVLDLLRPTLMPARAAAAANEPGGSLVRGSVPAAGAVPSLIEAEPIDFHVGRSSGIWGDVDNDGRLDFLLATSDGCRYAELYTQNSAGHFAAASFQYGLFRTAAGPDAVLADLDNDGHLDLVTFVDGHLRIYRNTMPTGAGANYAEIDLTGEHAVGARVTLWADGVRYTRDVTCGRGSLVQEPARVQFGLGSAHVIDSAFVRWGNGSVEALKDLAINHVASVHEGGAHSPDNGGASILAASPNPFSTSLRIRYRHGARERVELGIYTMDGAPVATLVDGMEDAGEYTATWNGLNARNEMAPQGAYMYRLRCGGADLTGKAVLVR
ncbi:MAG TPA: CRTAC1 family protein [Candidatus Kapabacteria bacterium]|nr:CRTAC1 family protein [Candidatus Kapabacteria bacterium]